MTRRIAGIIVRPRSTLAELVQQPAWVDTWIFILAVCGVCGVLLLRTDVGRQALVDERVRVIESFGGTIDDAQYERLQARPPWWVYVTSGGRMLLTPPATLLAALGVWALARRDGRRVRFSQSLAITVHATVVLALGQIFATPLHYIRESLTTPLNLAALLPLVEDGSIAARFLGSIDVFALWWLTVLALGLAALTNRRVVRYGAMLATMYFAVAAVVAGVIAAAGGS